jgi:HD domain
MNSVVSVEVAEPVSTWAERVSRRLLEPLGARWGHTLGVAERARSVGGALEADDAELLLAAAYLHDVGYAPELVQTGFHPVDGARFVRACGHGRLAALVAYHSGAAAEAGERGLAAELSGFEDERSVVSRALTYCDLTTDSDGRPVEPRGRFAEIRRRYGQAAPQARALKRSQPALLDDVRTMEAMLSERGVTDLALPASQMGGP